MRHDRAANLADARRGIDADRVLRELPEYLAVLLLAPDDRAAATLLILGLFSIGVITLLMVAIPIIGAEIATLIESLPTYTKRVQALVVDPNHPWISKIVGAGLSEVQQSSSELTGVGAGWLTDILRSLWSEGRALISIFSLLVVTPIVTAYRQEALRCALLIEKSGRGSPKALRETGVVPNAARILGLTSGHSEAGA
jgi:hypothetical protein